MAKVILRVKSGALSSKEIQDLKDEGYIVLISDDVNIVITDMSHIAEKIALKVLFESEAGIKAHDMREWFSRLLINTLNTTKN